MIPEKNAKNEYGENSPFDIYSAEYSTRFTCENNNSSHLVPPNSTMEINTNPNANANTLNKYDEDDEEDFIKIYFASGTVLKPSDEPYNLRSKINQANQELLNDNNENKLSNAPGKVKFDNTVVILDSFEDIGTVSIGTEILQGAGIVSDENNAKEEDTILAKVDLIQNDEDDQNDVVCSTTDRTQDTTDTTDDKVYSSTSFSRSFSSESGDDPLFINMIESGDEFKTIMNRNGKTQQGSAIDEHVAYFPELFTHTQYKMYENSGKTLDDDDDDDDGANDVNIYVPKKLDVDELRNKLKEISVKEPKIAVRATNGGGGAKKAEKPVKKAGGPSVRDAQKKIKQVRTSEKNKPTAVHRQQHPTQQGRPRTTYYFELDPKGKLRPLNKNGPDDCNGGGNKSSTKFFHINLKAAKNDENAKPRITKTSNSDLFLEFQTVKSGNKGAKLVIKKKQPAEDRRHDLYTAATVGVAAAAAAKKSIGADRPRLPGYNGLRSEYGLSAEQLLERRRIKMERERRRKEFRQRKCEEEQRKRAENEKNFYKWLQQKKQQKKQSKTRHSYPMNRLTVSSARTSINFMQNGNNQRKGSFPLEELLKIKDENGGWFKF